MRRATSLTIHQSGLASPAGSRNARCREIRRSELVTVPDFSPQACAGSSTCTFASTVSLERTFSDTTNNSSLFSAYAPGGGYKQSGLGRERGPEGIRAFQEVKHMVIGELK